MRVAILGGAFNPPHLGHILVAQQVLDFTSIKEVWFLPAYKHSFNKIMDLLEHRLAMTRLLKLPRTKVSTLELDHQLNGHTINLVPLLEKFYPQDSFTFIIGSDQLPTFHKWGKWRELLQKIPFLVVPRAGFALKPLYKEMKVLRHPLLVTSNISSTLVRKRVKTGLSIDHLVSSKIKTYIQKHQLYL